jgi:hypothetical protein
MSDIRQRSGTINSDDRVVALLYILLRDGDVAPGRLEEVVQGMDAVQVYQYSNGWIARYALDVAERLRRAPVVPPKEAT